MGFVRVKTKVCSIESRDRCTELELLADTGAMFSVVPADRLRELGIEPEARRSFALANGARIEREVGNAVFEWDGYSGASPVIFGDSDDHPILGVVSLEAMGLEVDPLRGTLKPMELLLL